MLTCADCHTSKVLSDFASSQQAKSAPRCKVCIRGRNQRYRAANRETLIIKQAAQYQANKTVLQAKFKKRWQERKHLYEPARQAWAAEHRNEMLTYYQEKGRDFRTWIDSLKQGVPCQDCGHLYPPYVMEYDHVRGEKRSNIGKMSNHKPERVLAEIAKCDLVCCACHRIRSHARRVFPRTPRLLAFRVWINELKRAPCKDCGKSLSPEAMDFDHVRGSKVENITNMWSWLRPKVLAELAKCDLVCANCHRVRTVQELRAEIKEAA